GEKVGGGEAGGREDQAPHDVVEGLAGGALEEHGEHHVPTVAVGEARTGREDLAVAVEQRQVRLRRGERVHRGGQDVVGDLPVGVLVEVVADAGGVGEQVLHRDGVVDEGQVGAEQLPSGLVQPQRAVLDEPHHRQRGERLAAAGDR